MRLTRTSLCQTQVPVEKTSGNLTETNLWTSLLQLPQKQATTSTTTIHSGKTRRKSGLHASQARMSTLFGVVAAMFLLFLAPEVQRGVRVDAQKLYVPNGCPEGTFFDPAGLECIGCGENEVRKLLHRLGCCGVVLVARLQAKRDEWCSVLAVDTRATGVFLFRVRMQIWLALLLLIFRVCIVRRDLMQLLCSLSPEASFGSVGWDLGILVRTARTMTRGLLSSNKLPLLDLRWM